MAAAVPGGALCSLAVLCRAEELRQSQVMEGGAGQAGARGGDGGEPPASEAQQQAEHVVDVLRTEVKALTIELEQTQADAERRQDRVQKELDGVQASLRAAEIERDDMHVQYLEAMKQMEALLEDKLQLKVCGLCGLPVVVGARGGRPEGLAALPAALPLDPRRCMSLSVTPARRVALPRFEAR